MVGMHILNAYTDMQNAFACIRALHMVVRGILSSR
jgi:hypothetical protein